MGIAERGIVIKNPEVEVQIEKELWWLQMFETNPALGIELEGGRFVFAKSICDFVRNIPGNKMMNPDVFFKSRVDTGNRVSYKFEDLADTKILSLYPGRWYKYRLWSIGNVYQVSADAIEAKVLCTEDKFYGYTGFRFVFAVDPESFEGSKPQQTILVRQRQIAEHVERRLAVEQQ